MRLQYVPTLVAIADEGSIRRAAEVLNKSQPAVTKTLRLAETDIGFPLFDRVASGVEPTDLGRMVIARSRAIASEHQRLIDEVGQLQGGEEGSVSVCVSPIAAVEVLPATLNLFRRKYPLVEVTVSSGLYPKALGPVRDGLTDILIGPTPPSELSKGLKTESLFETGTILITGENSRWLKARKLAELTDAHWVLIGPRDGPGNEFGRAFHQHDLTPPNVRTLSESYFGALALIESLDAVCNFPERLLGGRFDNWRVRKIDIREKMRPMEIAMTVRSGLPLTPAADHLANCIRRRCSSLSAPTR